MIIEEWVKHITKTKFNDLDFEIIDRAKMRIIDVIGCMIAGTNASGSDILIDLIRGWGGTPEATSIFYGIKAPAHNVAMLNSILARSYDFGPVMPYVDNKPLPAHISESTIPTALTMAEWQKASGKDLLTALILGDDIIARMLAACNRGIPGGWECTGVENVFGTTVIAGKLMGLTDSQLMNALGLSLNQMSGTMQNIYDGVMAFKLPQGLAARAGVFSVELAQRGFLGIKDSLCSKYGFFTLFCPNFNEEILTRDLGKKYYTDSCFKMYPSCASTHPTIECALNLIRDHDIQVKEIESITINVAPILLTQPLGQPFKIGEFPQGDAAFNLYYVSANVLVRKGISLEHFADHKVRDPAIMDLIKKTTIIGNIPNSKHTTTAGLIVRMKDGKLFDSYVDGPRGTPLAKPVTNAEIEEKFRRNIAFAMTVTDKHVDNILELLYNLEDVENIDQLIHLLISPTSLNLRI
ncbi:MAG: MmgE/PrpD family protein [Dehalococcoidales bacterium]|nr:MmgE/PrpD family protein [Dehalococcoidales bacterium]